MPICQAGTSKLSFSHVVSATGRSRTQRTLMRNENGIILLGRRPIFSARSVVGKVPCLVHRQRYFDRTNGISKYILGSTSTSHGLSLGNKLPMEQPVSAMLAVDKTLPARSVRKPVSGADHGNRQWAGDSGRQTPLQIRACDRNQRVGGVPWPQIGTRSTAKNNQKTHVISHIGFICFLLYC